MNRVKTIALAGNPNVGKTTVFNALTCSKQRTGNWPGKTVEKKEGRVEHNGFNVNIVDLPGTYSLNSYSDEETVARDFITNKKPDAVIHIIDSCNLERNLFLSIQMIELGANVIIALNMSDIAKKKGIEIDNKKLSELLGIPVIFIQANKKIGLDTMLDKALKDKKKSGQSKIQYCEELEDHISKLELTIKNNLILPDNMKSRWVAIKLLENDANVLSDIGGLVNSDIVIRKSHENRDHLQGIFGKGIDTVLTDATYGFISGLVRESVECEDSNLSSRTDKIDKVLTNKYIGVPLFMLMTFIIFALTFWIAAPISELIDNFFGITVSVLVGNILEGAGSPLWFSSFVIDGVIGGVGSVLVFIPFIFLLFFAISLLEDSGYMARAAFVMDRVMHKIGLHGKSFMPLVLGFGCTVPAIMATRILKDKHDKILTTLISPFMSCGAKLPVYALIAAALFPHNAGLVIFSLYALGILIAILMAFVLNKIFFKGLSSPFVMELPPYRTPTLTGAIIHMWERGRLFIKKAGTVIFAAVIFIWFFASVPFGVGYASEESLIGMFGNTISPVFAPLGFGDGNIAISLVMGFAAKEIVVGTLGSLYGSGDGAGLIFGLRGVFTPLSAYAFLAFVLLYIPCISTIAVTKREIGSKWALFSIVYTTGIAWIVAFIIYQGGILLGFV